MLPQFVAAALGKLISWPHGEHMKVSRKWNLFAQILDIFLINYTIKRTVRYQVDFCLNCLLSEGTCATVSTWYCVIVILLIRCEDLCERPIVECWS